jgi:hypothetical protein
VVFDSSRGSTRESCTVSRPVSLRQSPTRPRDMTMSRMWGGGPTRQTRQTRWTLSEEE